MGVEDVVDGDQRGLRLGFASRRREYPGRFKRRSLYPDLVCRSAESQTAIPTSNVPDRLETQDTENLLSLPSSVSKDTAAFHFIRCICIGQDGQGRGSVGLELVALVSQWE